MLSSFIDSCINLSDDLNAQKRKLTDLVHARFSNPKSHNYLSVLKAIMNTFDMCLGSSFDVLTRLAWTKIFSLLIRYMIPRILRKEKWNQLKSTFDFFSRRIFRRNSSTQNENSNSSNSNNTNSSATNYNNYNHNANIWDSINIRQSKEGSTSTINNNQSNNNSSHNSTHNSIGNDSKHNNQAIGRIRPISSKSTSSAKVHVLEQFDRIPDRIEDESSRLFTSSSSSYENKNTLNSNTAYHESIFSTPYSGSPSSFWNSTSYGTNTNTTNNYNIRRSLSVVSSAQPVSELDLQHHGDDICCTDVSQYRVVGSRHSRVGVLLDSSIHGTLSLTSSSMSTSNSYGQLQSNRVWASSGSFVSMSNTPLENAAALSAANVSRSRSHEMEYSNFYECDDDNLLQNHIPQTTRLSYPNMNTLNSNTSPNTTTTSHRGNSSPQIISNYTQRKSNLFGSYDKDEWNPDMDTLDSSSNLLDEGKVRGGKKMSGGKQISSGEQMIKGSDNAATSTHSNTRNNNNNNNTPMLSRSMSSMSSPNMNVIVEDKDTANNQRHHDLSNEMSSSRRSSYDDTLKSKLFSTKTSFFSYNNNSASPKTKNKIYNSNDNNNEFKHDFDGGNNKSNNNNSGGKGQLKLFTPSILLHQPTSTSTSQSSSLNCHSTSNDEESYVQQLQLQDEESQQHFTEQKLRIDNCKKSPKPSVQTQLSSSPTIVIRRRLSKVLEEISDNDLIDSTNSIHSIEKV